MSAEPDARLLNWRFIVPSEPAGLLLLPGSTETLPGAVLPDPAAPGVVLPGLQAPRALEPQCYPAVAVPDLAAWVPQRRPGTPGMPGGPGAAARLLATLAGLVAPGGWLCAGFANRWYPAAPVRAGSLSLAAALRALRRAGLAQPEVYAALPDQRRPAFLVPLARAAEMDYMLAVLFETSLPAGGTTRRLLAAARRLALAAPRARRRAVPAYYLVAGKPR